MEPTFFISPQAFRKWLHKHHATAPEVVVGFWKKATGKQSMTWSEAVDQALCYGWIDSRGLSLGDEAHQVRFTPRRPGSVWSTININKVKALTEQGLMQPAGIEAYNLRKEDKSSIYAHEQGELTMPKDMERKFKANKTAWNNYAAMAPSYRKNVVWWLVTARQEATQQKRLQELIADSEAGIKVKHLRALQPKKKG
ncbi:MAG: bacteriocin-protection protein [Sphingobacteriales bacterium]|nr:MAG: bacteriocin-protection protein [Sphingobacteriales bacterium]